MLKDFKKFILRGNVVDLAVAVVIGAAFTGIVNALVKDMVTPLIAAIGGQPDFGKLYFSVNNSKFMYGDLLNSIISFLLISLVVFFFIVQPINKLVALSNKNKTAEEPTEKKCEHCLSKIPKAAKVCAFCTKTVKV
jgi:large conductance mechanosensitive channel